MAHVASIVYAASVAACWLSHSWNISVCCQGHGHSCCTMLMLKLPLLWLDNVVVAIAASFLLIVACIFLFQVAITKLAWCCHTRAVWLSMATIPASYCCLLIISVAFAITADAVTHVASNLYVASVAANWLLLLFWKFLFAVLLWSIDTMLCWSHHCYGLFILLLLL